MTTKVCARLNVFGLYILQIQFHDDATGALRRIGEIISEVSQILARPFGISFAVKNSSQERSYGSDGKKVKHEKQL